MKTKKRHLIALLLASGIFSSYAKAHEAVNYTARYEMAFCRVK